MRSALVCCKLALNHNCERLYIMYYLNFNCQRALYRKSSLSLCGSAVVKILQFPPAVLLVVLLLSSCLFISLHRTSGALLCKHLKINFMTNL